MRITRLTFAFKIDFSWILYFGVQTFSRSLHNSALALSYSQISHQFHVCVCVNTSASFVDVVYEQQTKKAQIVFLINQFEYNLCAICLGVCWCYAIAQQYLSLPLLFGCIGSLCVCVCVRHFSNIFTFERLTNMHQVSNGFYVAYKHYLIMCTSKWIL